MWIMWGWSHADFPLVSQQHGTSHRIEQYHIILIREMCWKAISSSNKWPTAQQKPEESDLYLQRLCHEKSLILSPLTCHPHSKDPLREECAILRGERKRRTEMKGLQGEVQGTLGEKGVLGSHQHLSAKRGACEGKVEAAILLLAGTMWSSLLPLFSFRAALFHMQTVAVAPTCLAKRCIQTGRAKKRRRGGVVSNGMEYKGKAWGVGWACPECQFFQATDVMPVPTVGEQRRD